MPDAKLTESRIAALDAARNALLKESGSRYWDTESKVTRGLGSSLDKRRFKEEQFIKDKKGS